MSVEARQYPDSGPGRTPGEARERGLLRISPARLMLLGGTPLGERRVWWNFVAADAERIERAKADWRAARFPPVPGETEFIPLPEG